MFTITWIYERPNITVPFYHESSDDARAAQEQFAQLRENSGLVTNYETSMSEDGLSYTSVWTYESINDFLEFSKLVRTVAPTHFRIRNNYITDNSHKLTGVASEPVWPTPEDPNTFMTTKVIGGLTI